MPATHLLEPPLRLQDNIIPGLQHEVEDYAAWAPSIGIPRRCQQDGINYYCFAFVPFATDEECPAKIAISLENHLFLTMNSSDEPCMISTKTTIAGSCPMNPGVVTLSILGWAALKGQPPSQTSFVRGTLQQGATLLVVTATAILRAGQLRRTLLRPRRGCPKCTVPLNRPDSESLPWRVGAHTDYQFQVHTGVPNCTVVVQFLIVQLLQLEGAVELMTPAPQSTVVGPLPTMVV
ncbi:hypothetical protein JB92DRAFT_2827821 [Gautieria morchelliformis]|nr:hypothetical protein JB92DRAFT_2827821 [Gautieria morchelliformis]